MTATEGTGTGSRGHAGTEGPVHIIAIGGGGFSDAFALGLDAYVLEQAAMSNPAVGFIATASGDAENYLLKFYQAFSSRNCRPSHLPLFRRVSDLESYVAAQNILYVGGGNTKSMLAVWNAWGLPQIIRRASADLVLAGISAGAVCWFQQYLTDASAAELQPLAGLSFLPGSACAHYRHEPERKPRYQSLVAAGALSPGIAIDDGAAVHFVGGQPRYVIAGEHGVGAYHVTPDGRGGAIERPLTVSRIDVS
jgi:peptidase E